MEEELLTSEPVVDTLGDDNSEEWIPPENWHGTGAGNTIILSVTPTPSPMPMPDNLLDDSQGEVVNEQVLETLQNIETILLENSEEENLEKAGEEGEILENYENNEELEGDPEEQDENSVTINDISLQLETIQNTLLQIEDDSFIHYKNDELINTFLLGFVVAFFCGFIVYCFLSRVR